MSVQTRITSSQSASPYALDPHFIRQLRNFMNNWVVEGGSFRFDGYRARLRVDQQPSQQQTAPHPWQIVRAGDLDVDMVDGILFSSAVTTAYSVPQAVMTSTLTLPNNETTKIWFKAEISNTPWSTFFALWTVDAVTVESGATLPTDTLDLSDIADGAGNVFIEIAEVITASGKVTAITQFLTTPYTLIFPLAIDTGPFECPPEEEPDP